MKLFNEINEMISVSYDATMIPPKRNGAEAGDTSLDMGHFHKTQMDVDGNGKTIQTISDYGQEDIDHVHEIKNGICLPAEDGHAHEVVA